MANDSKQMVVIYDGDCPFCQSYVTFMALRERVGSVDLVDARSGDPRVLEIQSKGYDLNEGMVAIFGGTIYYGSDALALITSLSERGGFFQQMLARLLSDPDRARMLYPAMKTGRRVALKLLGRKPIASVSGVSG